MSDSEKRVVFDFFENIKKLSTPQFEKIAYLAEGMVIANELKEEKAG